MGKLLRFKNGHEFMFTNSSTINELTTVVGDYGDVDDLRVEFTEENLSDVTFDDKHYTKVKPLMSSAHAESEGNITATFVNELSMESELEMLREQVSTLTEKNDELVERNESLVTENDNLTKENTSLINENSVLASENESLTSENESLANENENLSNENQNLINENEQLTDKATAADILLGNVVDEEEVK